MYNMKKNIIVAFHELAHLYELNCLVHINFNKEDIEDFCSGNDNRLCLAVIDYNNKNSIIQKSIDINPMSRISEDDKNIQKIIKDINSKLDKNFEVYICWDFFDGYIYLKKK